MTIKIAWVDSQTYGHLHFLSVIEDPDESMQPGDVYELVKVESDDR